MGSVRRADWRQYVRYLVLNVIVSAVTITAILLVWGRRPTVPSLPPTPTIDVGALIASKVPTVTPTIPPTPTPVTYTVRSGDTLLSISLQLGISQDALMAANGLTDPNKLAVGQVLTVPSVESSSTATAVQSTAAPATQTPTPADNSPAEVEIRGVDGAGVLETETVRLRNNGGVAAMVGWTLDDGQGQVYRFPSGFTLYTDGAVSVHSKAGSDTAIDLYWGLPTPVWTAGKTITLRDPSGAVQSTFKLSPG